MEVNIDAKLIPWVRFASLPAIFFSWPGVSNITNIFSPKYITPEHIEIMLKITVSQMRCIV